MLVKSAAILASLIAVATAVPHDLAQGGFLVPRDYSIPGEVPSPPPGMCSLLVCSSGLYSLGGVPTSVSGTGVGPSMIGKPSAGVISHLREIVGDFKPINTGSSGFNLDIPLFADKIVDAGTVHMTAGSVSHCLTYRFLAKDTNDNFL